MASKEISAETNNLEEIGTRSKNNESPKVLLNVGGHVYETNMAVLQKEPDSMLARFVKNETDKIRKGQELTINRNGKLFKYVLDYLANGNDAQIPTDYVYVLRKEADCFQLQGLHELLKFGRNFDCGDLVIVKNTAFINSIMIRPWPCEPYLCWTCRQRYSDPRPKDPTFSYREDEHRDAVVLQGKIEEKHNSIDAKCAECATVSFPWSMLVFAFGGDCSSVDPLVDVHMPLKDLKLAD